MSCSVAIANATAGEESEGGQVFYGIILCELAAMTLAFSMNVQRYALTTPVDDKNRISIKGCKLSRNQLWGVGILLYAVANGFYVMGMAFAPLSLVSALFATSLVFNAGFAVCLLGEKVTRSDMIGDGVILASVIVCAVFAPSENIEYSAFDIGRLAGMATGVVFILFLVCSLGVLICVVMWFERAYPSFGPTVESKDDEEVGGHRHKIGSEIGSVSAGAGGSSISAQEARKRSKFGNRLSFYGKTSVGIGQLKPKKKPFLRRISLNLSKTFGLGWSEEENESVAPVPQPPPPLGHSRGRVRRKRSSKGPKRPSLAKAKQKKLR